MASIAELYMTPPLWDDQSAEVTWEDCLKSALELDSSNIDALQWLANLRVMRAKDDEAKELIKSVFNKGYSWVKETLNLWIIFDLIILINFLIL